ncbi:uncharacterized protein [Watersipora subatra]|uniref:uncharacterized protein n=1 Tax=Watersipora subatra TaxID=2589382 RepID=UPI00355B3B04
MVLLTAIKNFRQYNNKKSTGNALSVVDLSAVPGIEHWSPSTGLIDKGMEIERYHAAFPALGTAVSPGCMESFNLSTVSRSHLDTYQLPSDAPANGVDAVTSVPSKSYQTNAQNRMFKHRKAKGCFQQPIRSNDNHGGHCSYKRPTKQSLLKPKKTFRDKQVNQNLYEKQRKFSGMQKKAEWKSWKNLDPVERYEATCSSTKAADYVCTPPSVECEWISKDILSSCLSKDENEEVLYSNQLRTLWEEDAEVAPVSLLWNDDFQAESGLSTENDFVSGFSKTVDNEDDDSKADIDYSLLEQSMASLKFCEDLPSTCQGSRLMPMFCENPISSMILSTSDVEETTDRAESALICNHGMEAYEIFLDCESSSEPELYKHRLLREIDSTLNFDWCRYQPTSWIDGNQYGSEKSNSLTSRYSCHCEFCRSRAWARTCEICRTPL